MKFKIDENLPFILKGMIESIGDHIVDSVYHEKITGIDDQSLISFCLKEERILITLDTDFMKITDLFYGIIILRSKTQGKNAIRTLFQDFLSKYKLEDTKGKIVIVESNQIRIRKSID